MRTRVKEEMIGVLRTFLIVAGAVIMLMALSPLSVDAAEIVPRPERENEIEESDEGNKASAKARGNPAAASIRAGDDRTQRSHALRGGIPAMHVIAVRALTGEVALGAGTVLATVPTPVIISDYRRALEAYLTLVGTLLPEPYLLQRVRPHPDPSLSHTTPVAGCLSYAGSAPQLVQDEGTSFHSQQRTQRVVSREPARSVLSIDLGARNKGPRTNRDRVASSLARGGSLTAC